MAMGVALGVPASACAHLHCECVCTTLSIAGCTCMMLRQVSTHACACTCPQAVGALDPQATPTLAALADFASKLDTPALVSSGSCSGADGSAAAAEEEGARWFLGWFCFGGLFLVLVCLEVPLQCCSYSNRRRVCVCAAITEGDVHKGKECSSLRGESQTVNVLLLTHAHTCMHAWVYACARASFVRVKILGGIRGGSKSCSTCGPHEDRCCSLGHPHRMRGRLRGFASYPQALHSLRVHSALC